jgi:parallel beta-helix repeat protein
MAASFFLLHGSVDAATLHAGAGEAYTTIQAAVDAASGGDTIVVRDGTYTENVDVSKSLIIQSENGAAACTVIASDSEDHVFDVTAHPVTIDGFTLYGASGTFDAGIHLGAGVRDSFIVNNRCGVDTENGNHTGISLEEATGNTVSGNTCSGNYYIGIRLAAGSDGNTVAGNETQDSYYGIHLSGASGNTIDVNTGSGHNYNAIMIRDGSNENIVIENTASQNGSYGIYLWNADDNRVENNSSTGNTAGVKLNDESAGNMIAGNTCTGNGTGISATGTTGTRLVTGNEISNNDCSGNTGNGISLSYAADNTVWGNICSDNGSAGIYLGRDCLRTRVLGNTCDTNGTYGIGLVRGSGASSFQCEILDNSFSGNAQGIYIVGAYDNIISGNTVSANTVSGLYINMASGNTLYLNDFIDNAQNLSFQWTTDNAWQSPTALTYRYDGAVFTAVLGNYYSDRAGADADGNGVADQPYVTGDTNDDGNPLWLEAGNYTIQQAGDIDFSGDVGLADAILSLQILAGIPPTLAVYPGADVDSDGRLGAPEALFDLQHAAGQRSP